MKPNRIKNWSVDSSRALKALGMIDADLRRLLDVGVPSLTAREIEIFKKIGQVTKSRAIAADLGISVKTVDIHRTHLCQKLGCSSAGIVRAWAVYQIAILAGEESHPIDND